MSQDSLAITRRLAAALDAEDYLAASELLAPSCIYHIGAAMIAGKDAIIDSYQANGDSAQRRFDWVEYVSHVEATGPSSAVISFTDRLRLGSESHEFHCRQHVRIGLTELIEEIVHEELPGERELLKDFEDRPRKGCSVERAPS